MKDALRTRLEFLWAKLAGRNIDINTLTPDAPTNMVEKLMMETADRFNDIEDGGEKFVITLEEVDESVSYDTSGKAWTCDRTMSELLDAIVANKSINCKFNIQGFGEYEGPINKINGYIGPETPIDKLIVDFLISIPFYNYDDRLDLVISVWDNNGETVAESYPLFFTISSDFEIDLYDGGEDQIPECNKTWNEISDAIRAGKNIIPTLNGCTCGFLRDKSVIDHGQDIEFQFIDSTGIMTNSRGPGFYRFSVSYQNVVSMQYYPLAPQESVFPATVVSQNLSPKSNYTYIFLADEMASLRIDGNAQYCKNTTVIFNTGSTPDVSIYSVVLPDGHTWEAYMRYKIFIDDGYVEVSKWPLR